MFDLDGKIVGEIFRNEWVQNVNNSLRRNYDPHAIEIIDQSGIPVLQVEYANTNKVSIGGFLLSDEGYNINPSLTVSQRAQALYAMSWTVNDYPHYYIIADDGMISNDLPSDPVRRHELKSKARAILEPWFVYPSESHLGERARSKGVSFDEKMKKIERERQ